LKKNYEFTVHTIESATSEKEYTSMISNQFKAPAYYSLEHLKYFASSTHKLSYFLLKKDDSPILLMPIILREIFINEIKCPYLDAISPYGYNGPLIKGLLINNEMVMFWELIDKWYLENEIISEFIRFRLNGNHIMYSGTLTESLFNIKGELYSDFENQWTAFLPKVRNNYRKANNFDLVFKIFEGDDLTSEIIEVFNNIYIQTMNRNKASGVYFFSKDYFENLIIKNSHSIAIAIAYYKNTPVSTELIMTSEDIIYAYLGGTDSEYFNYRPNDFLRVKIIEWAITQNKKYYVLGGGIQNGDGLYKSKKALFPKDENVVFYTGRKIIDKNRYDELCSLSDKNYNMIKEASISEHFFPYYRFQKLKN